MNRGLVLFLVFLGVLALGLSLTAAFLGPNVLAFVFHDDRADAPVTMVELVRVDAEQARRFETAYAKDALAAAEAVGARLVWKATTDLVVVGVAADNWSQLALVEYPSRATYIDLVTSAEFRALAPARDEIVDARASLAGTALTEFHLGDAGAFVVRLLTRGEDEPADLWRASLAEAEQLLAHHGGDIVWRAALNPLVASEQDAFDHLLVFGFPDETSRDAWLNDAKRSTLHSLQRRHLRRDVLLVVDRLD